jgi:hypothetical protein
MIIVPMKAFSSFTVRSRVVPFCRAYLFDSVAVVLMMFSVKISLSVEVDSLELKEQNAENMHSCNTGLDF